jgi:hypothetical protein
METVRRATGKKRANIASNTSETYPRELRIPEEVLRAELC